MYSYWYNLAEINCTPWALQCPIKIYFLPHVVLNPFNSSTLEAEICLSEFETSLGYITMSRTVNSQHYTETMSHRILKENKESYYLFEMHRVLLHLKCSVLCKKKQSCKVFFLFSHTYANLQAFISYLWKWPSVVC